MGVFASRNDLLVRTSDGRNVTLAEDLVYESDSGARYRAPIGTVSDGASIPQAAWAVLQPFGPYWLGSILHDAAYRNTLEKWINKTSWAKAELTRDESDNLFFEAMTSLGVDNAEKWVIYDAVRQFGQAAFEKDRAQ